MNRVKDALFDLALLSVLSTFDRVDEIERRQSKLIRRSSFESKTFPVSGSKSSTTQRTFAGLPSNFPAQAFRCGSALARNEFSVASIQERCRLTAEQRQHAVCNRDATARRPHDFEFGRRRFPPAIDSTVVPARNGFPRTN